jgi:hypothetical protein
MAPPILRIISLTMTTFPDLRQHPPSYVSLLLQQLPDYYSRSDEERTEHSTKETDRGF